MSIGAIDVGDLVERIIRRRAPELLYGGVYRYRVLPSSSGGRLDLEPVRTRKIGPLPKFYQWTGGIETTPQAGSEAVVAFLDADPTQPIVLGLAPLQGPGGLPASLRIDASAITIGASASQVLLGNPQTPKRFAREGDVYSLGTASGTLTLLSTPQASGPTKGEG